MIDVLDPLSGGRFDEPQLERLPLVCSVRVRQFPAALYCSITLAGTRPRFDSSILLDAAQARTALRSTLLLLLVGRRVPPVLRAALIHGPSSSRSFLAFLSLRSSS